MDYINMFFVFALLCPMPLLVTLPTYTNAQKLQKIPITCDAGSFTDGQYGSVTCNFHKVMQDDKRGINVVLYPLNATDTELGTDVLACQWKETLFKYHCIVGEGYTFDYDISDRLTVGISAVGEKFKGLYMCFIVPSEETDKHACELKLKDSKTQTVPGEDHTNPPDYKDEDTDQWIVPVVIVVVLVGLSVLFVLLWKYRFMSKRPTDKKQADPDASDPLLSPENNISPEGPTSVQDNQSVLHNNIILEGFQLRKPDIELVCKYLLRELDASSKTQCKTCIKRSTRVQPLPKGNEKGDFLSLSIGSDGVDIRRVILSGLNTEFQSAKYDLPTVTTTGEENTEEPDLISFFFGVAGCAKAFLKSQKLTTKAFLVEYVSHSQFGPDDDVTMERVKECANGLVSEDDMDRDASELQQNALRKMNATHRLKIKPTVKDPVGTLLSGIYHDQACTVAFLPEAQLTACYVPEHNTDQKEAEITTIEWEDTGFLEIFKADIDREFDESSKNHSRKTLDQMVSWKHIGEILRLALLKVHNEGAVFMSAPTPSALHGNGSITFKHVSMIESDLNGNNELTRIVLDELKIENYTPEDCDIVRNVCKTIIERSAHLTAAALAALIIHVNQKQVIIAVDGFMYRDHAEFYKIMDDKTKELLNENYEFKLLPQYNGRRIGATVASVLAPKEDSKGIEA